MNRDTMNGILGMLIVVAALLLASVPVLAGELDAPGSPKKGSNMPTTSDIYNQLDTGIAVSASGAFVEPTDGPTIGTGKTLAEIQGKLPVADNVNGAAIWEVLSGKTFWGLRPDGTWGLKIGTIVSGVSVTGANGSLIISISDALYTGNKTATAVDSNLLSGNIRSGVSIFGVGGKTEVVDTTETSAPAAAANILSGKKAFVNGALITGTAPSSGFVCTGTLNGTRWCDNGNGTIRDMTTGVTWLKNANCTANLAGIAKTGALSWNDAVNWSSALLSGQCDLTDGSTVGDWRMPTKNELKGLANGLEAVRYGTPRIFYALPDGFYWSGSSLATFTDSAWYVYLNNGYVGYINKFENFYYVWPVRSGL